MEKGALILEGGSLRSLFTAGVLDVFMENDLYFSDVTGVSAGALTGVSYVSKQPGRTAQINIGYVNDKRYLGVNNLLLHHEIFNFDFLFNELSREILPFDFNTFFSSPMHFTAVATSLDTGEPVYFEKDACPDILTAVRASSSMPVVSKAVTIDGKRYLDGGCSMAIPYQKAIDDGFEKIVLVLTRQQGYRKLYTRRPVLRAYAKYFRHYPNFIRALFAVPTRYDRQQREIDELEKAGRIFVIRPQQPVNVSHTERDVEKLTALYNDGHKEAERQLEALRAYLAK
ncbi:MAG: patatin family protein [Ruminococcus bromii]|nr:patatin family protein [Ruminococcus bromii]